MFLDLFYGLREEGVPLSIHEWQTFLRALEQGLHGSNLLRSYHLGREVLRRPIQNTRKIYDFPRGSTASAVFRFLPSSTNFDCFRCSTGTRTGTKIVRAI